VNVTEQIVATAETTVSTPPNRLRAHPIQPVVAPLWLGAERRGVELGAVALDAGLRARWERRQDFARARRALDSITIPTPEPATADAMLHQRSLMFLAEVAETCNALAEVVAAALARGELPVMLGGDHALAAGSIAGASRASGHLGVLWFDSHADMNTPATSPSGHIHGMSLAAALGDGPGDLVRLAGTGPAVSDGSICLLGVRDLDPSERLLIAERGIWMLTMEEWHDLGIREGVERALSYLSEQGVDAVHVSFDLDVLDPLDLPGTGTPVPGGVRYREASQLLRLLHAWDGPIRSLDWVELNPTLDLTGRSTDIAVSLLSTLLGETMR
jgi:arginase